MLRRAHRGAAPQVRERARARLRHRGLRTRPLPGQPLSHAWQRRRRLPRHSRHAAQVRPSWASGSGRGARLSATRPRARQRCHRQRQEHDPRRAHRPREPPAPRAHRVVRGSHRVPARAPVLSGHPARGRERYRRLRPGAPAGPAAGPRRRPGRRDARPGDHRGRAQRRGDRPPRPLDAAHRLRGPDHHPGRRRLPAASAGAGARAARARASGRRRPAARPPARRHGAGAGHRGDGRHSRDPQPHPRGEDASGRTRRCSSPRAQPGCRR